MNMKDRLNQAYKGAKPPLADEAEREATKRRGPETPRPGKQTQASASAPRSRSSPASLFEDKGILAPSSPRPKAANSSPPAAKAQTRKANFSALPLPKPEAREGGLLKTGGDSGLSKAAKFLLLLGADEAAKVISHLSQAEVEQVSREILGVKSIDAIEANEILAEFGWLVQTKGYSIEGGPETAEKMLTAAFGPERAKELLRKASPGALRPFRFLNDFEPRELFLILKDESPQVVAVILPYLEPKRASGLIELFSELLRIDIVKRIARLEKVSPDIIRRVEETLKDRIRKIGNVSSDDIDGTQALAGILRNVDPRLEESILAALDEESPQVSRDVRERLFTLEDVLRVPGRDLQKALREFQDRDLALLLKGRAEDFKDKILGSVSANRRTLIMDEYSILGAVRREDADEAAREFLGYLKRAWEDGELILDGEDELVE